MELRNKQFLVEKDQLVQVDLLSEEPGKEIVVDQVLLVGNSEKPAVGQPLVPNAKVVCEVVRHLRGEKKVSYKFRRRKDSEVKKGFRAELTELKIKDINIG